MASNIQKKKTLSNPQISPTHFSQNILIENELNAIGKLPPDLADRAMTLLEKSANARIENDKAIIDLEKQNIELQELDTKKYYTWSGFGMLGFFAVSILSLVGGVFLAYFDKTTKSYIAFAIAFANLTPKLLKELRRKS